MDRTAVKKFAIEARRILLQQVAAQTERLGITIDRITEPQTVSGGLIVAGITLDTIESHQYQQLRRRLQDLQSQEKTLKGAVTALIDEVAYTWFNRLAALRFMEVNGYLKRRVLSSSDPKLVDPDLLRDGSDIAELADLPGLNRSIWLEWRGLAAKAPNPEEFLYRRLLGLQCQKLAVGLPFLFAESYPALLMPGNLLNQDSIVRKLVADIAEVDWLDTPDSENGVEIVGWLYQFYISERKDAVIGAKSKVAARDIPAATQLFTPHWIVRYMVENSLGRLWLEVHPESQLRAKMPYYLPPHPPAPVLSRFHGRETRPERAASPTGGEGGQDPRNTSNLLPPSPTLVGEGLGVRANNLSNTPAKIYASGDLPPHPPAPSPTRGEGGQEKEREQERERWEVPERLKQRMIEIAREFRKQPTASEAVLWQALRGRKLAERKFRRQQPIGNFVVDFFCAAERLIVEIDGAVHNTPEQQSLDRERQQLLESLDLKFVRVTSQQVESDLPTTLNTIQASFLTSPANLMPPLCPPWERGLGGEGLSSAAQTIREGLPQRPEELTVIDPACGSGHILVYAFDLLFEIYKEQGYLERDIPALILTHNLHGLDIDDRAVQLASFAVLMKARAKNPRILRKPPQLKILTVRSTRHLSISHFTVDRPQVQAAPIIDYQLTLDSIVGSPRQLPLIQPPSPTLPPAYPLLEQLLATFAEADNLGSLITPDGLDAVKLSAQLDQIAADMPVFASEVSTLREVVRQAELLSQKYWVVVANPPYMGSGSFNSTVKNFIEKNYEEGKEELYATYILRNLDFCSSGGSIGMITIPSWMFLSSFSKLRFSIIHNYFIESLIHNGRGVFGSDFGSCSFTIRKKIADGEKGVFKRLFEKQGSVASNEELEKRFYTSERYYSNSDDFTKIPGSPITYWSSKKGLEGFELSSPLSDLAETRNGMKTANNFRFVRHWHEVSIGNVLFSCQTRDEAVKSYKKWFPYNDGGNFRKWYGNNEVIVNWLNDGEEVKDYIRIRNNGGHWSRYLVGLEKFFSSGITWTAISSGSFAARLFEQGYIFSTAGMCLFSAPENRHQLIGLLNSVVGKYYLGIISPTLNCGSGEVGRFPVKQTENINHVQELVQLLRDLQQTDWDNFETSWDFQTHPLLRHNTPSLAQAFTNWHQQSETAFAELKRLEEENNRYWIEAYGLQAELSPEVPDEQITIRRADLARDIRSLISYAVGCMMGRYSLDTPGLICAGGDLPPHPPAPSPTRGEGGQEKEGEQDSSNTSNLRLPSPLVGEGLGVRGQIFAPSPNAILPITDPAYFDDDIVSRFVEFLKVAYSPDTLTENLDFIATALELKPGETALQRLRRYFLTEFISDHIKTYKKRPIYWLFTSGKAGSRRGAAFGALVYLHRYTPATVARLRTDYVLELQLKLDQEIQQSQQQQDTSTTTAAKKAAAKQLKTRQDQQTELRDYQAKLQTVADSRIELDLDDGVAYNYTRFKGLVYEGSDLKMSDLEAKAQWKIELLAQAQKLVFES